MKKSNLFLGASAVVLAIAGAFTTKAAKDGHHLSTIYTKKDAGECLKHQGLRINITANQQTNRFTTGLNNATAFKTAQCKQTLWTITD